MPRAEGYAFATGTTSAVVTIPGASKPTDLVVIDSVQGTVATAGTAGAVTITTAGVIMTRKQFAANTSDFLREDFQNGWPLWRTSGSDAVPWGSPQDTFNPPNPATATYPIYGGVAASAEANQAAGQSGTVTTGDSSIHTIALYLQRIGNPTDNLVMELYDTAIDGGSLLGTATVPALSVRTSPYWVYFRFSPSAVLGFGAQFFIRLTRSGARSTANYIQWIGASTSAYGGGGAYTLDNTTWSAESATDDLAFQTLSDILVRLTAPASSTGAYLGVTYHYEKPSEVRN